DALRGVGVAALIGTRPTTDDLVMLLALPPAMSRSTGVEHVADALEGAGVARTPDRPAALAAGPLTTTWGAVPDALRAAAEVAGTMRDAPPRRWHDATVPDVDRLLWALRDDEHLARFARQRLAPLLDLERPRDAVLLPTLEQLCARHWHKAEAARALAIQRQSLYARIERLARVLRADLDDAETRLGLEIAVRALRVARLDDR
ncbi:MAG: PucR family transcriptional regulator, partial [Nocardioides sp.]